MDPSRFRAGSVERRCGTCRHFADETLEWGRCRLYERAMQERELCDSWRARGVLVIEKGAKTS